MELEDVTDEEYYAEMKLMFRTDGWKLMLAELEDQAALIADIQTIKTDREHCFKQGQLATIGYLMNFERTLKTAEEDAAEDLADDGD
jgi:hypothetical protein